MSIREKAAVVKTASLSLAKQVYTRKLCDHDARRQCTCDMKVDDESRADLENLLRLGLQSWALPSGHR